MALIYIMGGYNFDRINTNAQRMYNIAKENKYLKNEIKIGYALFYGKSENSISHATISLGENKMIEASGHFSDKRGKQIRIGNISNGYIGIADFIYTPFNKEKKEDNKSEIIRLNSIIILILLLL
jgi:cell wall-associated NlpC family hydrolase